MFSRWMNFFQARLTREQEEWHDQQQQAQAWHLELGHPHRHVSRNNKHPRNEGMKGEGARRRRRSKQVSTVSSYSQPWRMSAMHLLLQNPKCCAVHCKAICWKFTENIWII